MECFVSTVPIDPVFLGIHATDFGQRGEETIRGHMSVVEFIAATGDLYTRFVEGALASGPLAPDLEFLVQAVEGTDAANLSAHLSVGLRLFREHLPKAFLEALFVPRNTKVRYMVCSLEELRRTDDRIVFNCTARPETPGFTG